MQQAQARKLVFTTVDRAVSYYEAARGSYELSGRVYASGGMGVPQSLTLVSNEAGKEDHILMAREFVLRSTTDSFTSSLEAQLDVPFI